MPSTDGEKPVYVFKPSWEFGFAALTAAVIFLLQVLAGWDPIAITDWTEWAITVAGGVVRAAAGGALAFITARRTNAD